MDAEPAVSRPETSSLGGVRAAGALVCLGEPELCDEALALLREPPWWSRAWRRSSRPAPRAAACPEAQSLQFDDRKNRGPEPSPPEKETPTLSLFPRRDAQKPNASLPRPPSRPSRTSPRHRRIPGPRETWTSRPCATRVDQQCRRKPGTQNPRSLTRLPDVLGDKATESPRNSRQTLMPKTSCGNQ